MTEVGTIAIEELVADEPNALCIGPFGSDLLSSDFVDEGVPVVFVRNVRPGRFVGADARYISSAKAEKLRSHRVRPGDIVITKMGLPPCVAATYPEGAAEGVVTADIIKLTPNRQRVEPRYVVHFLNSPAAKAQVERFTFGVTRPKVTLKDFRRLRLPFPSLKDQRRIADILDKAYTIRHKRKEATALTNELLRSRFLEMFGDPVTNPRGWPTESIEDLCSRGAALVDGPFGSSLKPEHYVESGVKVVRNWNIYDDLFDFTEFKYVTPAKFEEIRRSEVLPGDVLVTTKGTVGDICVAPELGGPAVLSASGTVRLRVPPDESYAPEFIVGQMITQSYKRYLHTFEAGSAQQYLNLSAIRKMRLIRPPRDLQEAFRMFRAHVRKAETTVVAAEGASEDLFGSLIERFFSRDLHADLS